MLRVVVPSMKATVPVGLAPVTVAEKVTEAPTVAGLDDVATAVVVLAWLTLCIKMAIAEPVLLVSPE